MSIFIRAENPLDFPPELIEAWNLHPEIVKLGDPVLEKVAKPIIRFDAHTKDLIDQMFSIMRKANGLGLAAPQIGVLSRLLVYDAGNGLQALINPKIVSRKGEQLDPPEGCLSIPGLQGQVLRAEEIRVKAFDLKGKPISVRASGLESRVIQHEIDHLDGILFFTKAQPDTLFWATGDEEDEGPGTR